MRILKTELLRPTVPYYTVPYYNLRRGNFTATLLATLSASISHNDGDSYSKPASQDDLRQDYPLEPSSMDSGYVSGGPLNTLEISRNRPLLAPNRKRAEPMLEDIAEDDPNEADEEDDTRSNLSVDSLGGSSLSSHISFFDQDVKAAAQALILEILEQDETLNALFQESLEKIEPQRVRKNLARFLQGYCFLLIQAGPTVDQQKGITFLKHRCMSFADAICTDFNPANIEAWKVWAAQRSKGQRDIRAAHLSKWLSGDFAASPTQAFETGDDGENENDEDSISSDDLPPVIEELKDFMVRGEPMDLFREHFRRFLAGESIKEWKELTKRRATTSKLSSREERFIYAPIRSPKFEVKAKSTDHSIVELPEEKGFRISWRCVSQISHFCNIY